MGAEPLVDDDAAIVDGKQVRNIKPGEQAHERHPYLSGNFAPIQRTLPLTPCNYTGRIPAELAGGQYVRNGGNPLANSDLGRDAHFFDGDGMLAGVLFRRLLDPDTQRTVAVRPEFVNQYVKTDVYISSKTGRWLRRPVLPSITTLVSPLVTLVALLLTILRSVFLVFLSHLPGSQWAIKRISVANTAVLWHDGRALATCESGPPMRVLLPALETVGWWDGKRAEGEANPEKGVGFGSSNPATGWMREWTTGHPHVDPTTGELVAYHNTFLAPYVHYSVVPATHNVGKVPLLAPSRLLNAPVPGVSGAKMMHDFGVSLHHTVVMDLPLTLNPFNLLANTAVVSYDPTAASRFGVFPRYRPDLIKWFETRACVVFHTANTWDTMETDPATDEAELCVNMLACRLTSSTLVFGAGNLAAPQPARQLPESQREEEQCRLYYWQFPFAELSPHPSPADEKSAGDDENDDDEDPTSVFSFFNPPSSSSSSRPRKTTDAKPTKPIRHQFALSAIPFEFPTLRPSSAMSSTRYIYGCSTDGARGFGASLGKGVKISHLAKIDALTLIERGKTDPPAPISGCVDTRSLEEVVASTDPEDPIRVFSMPDGWFAQEASFVPRAAPPPTLATAAHGRQQQPALREDDGWLLTYVFDERQIDAETGMARDGARSELWVIDARNMTDVVCRVALPQRVPYGLHGEWFDEAKIRAQRPVTAVRELPVCAAERREAERDEETRVQSPSEEKENPFEKTLPVLGQDAEQSTGAGEKTGEHRSRGKVRRSRSQRAVAAALARRKWSPAWRAWMTVREAMEKRLG